MKPTLTLKKSIIMTGLALMAQAQALTLEDYTNPDAPCVERVPGVDFTLVADAHTHYRPFGGESYPYMDVVNMIKNEGVLFSSAIGIGQRLPAGSTNPNTGAPCESYRDCPGVPASPSTENDHANMAGYALNQPNITDFVISNHMTFPDLANPSTIAGTMQTYFDQYGNDAFAFMGEANVVKQALFPNGHVPVTLAQIDNWGPFMSILESRKIPLMLHSDLGCSPEDATAALPCAADPINDPDNAKVNTKYLPLIQKAASTYPNNKIVWLHLGMSSQQKHLDPNLHIKVLREALDAYPNLSLDISWGDVLTTYFFDANGLPRPAYVDFLNQYSNRIITGSDYVAYPNKTNDTYSYKTEVTASSKINQHLNNTAFRNIALGQSFLNLAKLTNQYKAPQVCQTTAPSN